MNTQSSADSWPFGGPAMTPDVDRSLPLPTSVNCPGLPPTAKAWAVNATAIPNGLPMPFLSMWPTGAGYPGVSQLNAFQGQTVSNSAIVPASSTGSINLRVNGPTHVAMEVTGYFAR